MSARRGIASTTLALIAAGVLLGTARSLPPPPLAGPTGLADWWRTNGTAVATMSMVRMLGLALSGYVAALGTIATIAAITRWSWADALAQRWATPFVRRLVVGGGLVASLSVPTSGGATSSTVFELVDIGPADSDFEIRDIGPAPGLQRSAPRSDRPVEPSTRVQLEPLSFAPAATTPSPDLANDTWLVAPGDHLWAIAAKTVADRGGDEHESTIASYWQRLIEHNRDVVGDDPDLIHPGQVIRLPD